MNFKPKNLNNNHGMGLVEVLVAVGILGVMAAGMMTMLTNGMKSQKGIQAKDQQREVMNEISSLLSRKQACINTFGAVAVNTLPQSVNAIVDEEGTAKFQINQNDKSGLLMFRDFEVSQWQQDPTSPVMGEARLTVKLTKIGEVVGVKDIQQGLSIRIKRNAVSNLIEECFAKGAFSDNIWKVSPLDSNSIYYEGGNVGLSNTNPQSRLVVGPTLDGSAISSAFVTNAGALPTGNGSLLHLVNFGFTSSNNTSLGVKAYRSANGSDWQTTALGLTFDVDNTSPVNNASIWMLANGFVGIKTPFPRAELEVMGAIKVGQTAAACSAALEGTQRYNTAVRAMEFCNGTNWTGFGGGGTTVFDMNGYTTMPNGLMIQWGRATANGNGITTINFPTNFTTAVYSVMADGTTENNAGAKDNWPSVYRAGSSGLNSFRVMNANDSNDEISWIAIGR